MAIIKGRNASTLLKDAIVLDLGDLTRQAEQLRQAAQTRANQMVREAQHEAARLTGDAEVKGLEQGRAKGFQKGCDEGLAKGAADALTEARQELARIQQLWRDAAADLEAQRQQLDRQSRQAVLELALRLAEKLVHRVIEVDPTVIVDQVTHALSHVLRPLDVAVRINPADRPVVAEAMPELLADFAQFKHLNLVDDGTVSPGGCVVNYGQGRIDATIETQLDRIVDLMLPAGTPVAHSDSAADETAIVGAADGVDEQADDALDAAPHEPGEAAMHDDDLQNEDEGQADER